jgi:hypothetical protein
MKLSAVRAKVRSKRALSVRVPLLALGAALACLEFAPDDAAGLVGDAPLATDDIARAVVGIVGPHSSFCTATAIASEMLLTAGHCVQPGVSYRVQFKDNNGLRQYSEIVDMDRPPQFSELAPGSRPSADLALVRVGEPFPAQIGIAILGLTQPPIWPGDKVIVVGGGIPFRGLHETGVNREATLVATGLSEPRHMWLTDASGKAIGACFGDSGAPVFQVEPDGAKVVGVVGWASGPNKTKGCGGITGATALSPYRAWIEGAIGRLAGAYQAAPQ